MDTILRAEDIYKVYQTLSGPVYALSGINLKIEKGLFYTIIGKSGSGKSTLLHILSGLDKPTNGKVFVKDKELFQYSDTEMAIFRRRNMGFVFQQFNLLEEYNVLNNICMPLKLDGRKADTQFLDEVTKILGIHGKLKNIRQSFRVENSNELQSHVPCLQNHRLFLRMSQPEI